MWREEFEIFHTFWSPQDQHPTQVCGFADIALALDRRIGGRRELPVQAKHRRTSDVSTTEARFVNGTPLLREDNELVKIIPPLLNFHKNSRSSCGHCSVPIERADDASTSRRSYNWDTGKS